MNFDPLQTILECCREVKNNRNIGSILRSITSEVGELAEEVDIALGTSYKEPDVDGIMGESVDIILGALDMIATHHPAVTSQQVFEIIFTKLDKWNNKVLEHQNKSE